MIVLNFQLFFDFFFEIIKIFFFSIFSLLRNNQVTLRFGRFVASFLNLSPIPPEPRKLIFNSEGSEFFVISKWRDDIVSRVL